MSKLIRKYDKTTGREYLGIVSRDEVAANVADMNYIHEQGTAAASWSITHNLGKYPSVNVIDSGGSQVFGQVNYLNENEITIEFYSAFSGKAILN